MDEKKKKQYEDVLRKQAQSLTKEEGLKQMKAVQKMRSGARRGLRLLGESPTDINVNLFMFGSSVQSLLVLGVDVSDIRALMEANIAVAADQMKAAEGIAVQMATEGQPEN